MNTLLQTAHWFFMSTDSLRDMLLSMPAVLEKIVRSIIIYLFMVVGLRLAGKRELAQLNPFDLVVLLLLSNTVQNAIIGNDNSVTGGIIGAATLLGINYFVVRFVFKHKRLDQMIEGSPTTLIEHGKILKANLAKELLTESELTTVAHRQGFDRLSDVETAVLEAGGSFYMVGRLPPIESERHSELISKLDKISRQLAALQEMKG
jgi:uncharacterized membrane protein YcaP (DUF421 family)